ncbi:hypothetical protein ABZU94_26485 [Streptomyces mirabilis]|uniref:hypothetical protein n=1 Tax=Streptomyces sp. NPDC005388 TaxID=3156717 RepID=UPI00339FB1CF
MALPGPDDAVLLADVGGVGEEESLSDLFGAADVRLSGEAEPARVVRDVPAFLAAVRLGHWCGGVRRAQRLPQNGGGGRRAGRSWP